MSRILKAYTARFRWLLQHARARRLDQGVEWLLNQARQLSAKEKISLAGALTRVHERLLCKPPFQGVHLLPTPDRFFCDAGLGGLARWLRAAGYDTEWVAGIDDDDLLQRARQSGTTILTTDSMLMERRVLRERIIPAYWLPPTLSISEQLELVFREFQLQLREYRCMGCGGELRRVEKQAVRDRIPPRTYVWLEEYFACARCGKLFWRGTHWQRIEQHLAELRSRQAGAPPSSRAATVRER